MKTANEDISDYDFETDLSLLMTQSKLTPIKNQVAVGGGFGSYVKNKNLRRNLQTMMAVVPSPNSRN